MRSDLYPRSWLIIIHISFITSMVNSQTAIPEEQITEDANELQLQRQSDFITEMQSAPIEKLNLNEIDKEALMQVPVLDVITVEKIWSYIQLHRPLLSVYELQTINGLTPELIHACMNYFNVDSRTSQQSILKVMLQPNHSLMSLRWSRNYPAATAFYLPDSLKNAYQGSPDHWFFKIRNAVNGRYSIGLHCESDAGESMFSHSIPIIDFISFHLSFDHLSSKVPQLIIGDYTLRLAQGLIIDNGFGAGKNIQLGAIVRSDFQIKPYQSINESDLFRGCAATIRCNSRSTLLLFFSKVLIDGNLTTIGNQSFVTSVQTSGLHRNLTELEDKHSISVINAGASFSGSVASLRFSSNVVFKKQDPPLDAESRVDRIFIPSGLNQWFYSINHLWIYHNVTLSGEWAIDKMFHLACIEHCLIGIGKKSELLLSFRHFHPGFYSNQSNTISANGLSWNEKGFYLAANTQIFRKLQFHGSIDFTGHPWLRYAEDDIRSQQEYGLRLQYTERRKWLIYFQYSHKNKEESRADPEKINENIIYLRQSDQFRLHLEMKLNSNWTWRSRIQIQKANLESNNRDAVLISQDFLYKSIESHFSANFRLALFDIPDYDLRIYSYENDLLNQFSLPAYNGRGIRLYANLRYKFSSALLLETKLATSYIYPDAISNIPDVMNESSYKTEIKIQMQFRF